MSEGLDVLKRLPAKLTEVNAFPAMAGSVEPWHDLAHLEYRIWKWKSLISGNAFAKRCFLTRKKDLLEMYDEDDLLPLSALQHLLFCERQCALIHVEQQWVENLYTAEGRIMHERVDSGRTESRGKVRIGSGLPLRSLRLGLVGKADIVEFHLEEGKSAPKGKGVEGWRPFPVEYKRGRPKKEHWDKVQLCAQAMCLEDMLGVEVPRGALFYGKTRRRVDVVFDADLRRETEAAALRLHALIASGTTPPARYDEKCENCSFLSSCLPKATAGRHSVSRYLANVTREPDG